MGAVDPWRVSRRRVRLRGLPGTTTKAPAVSHDPLLTAWAAQHGARLRDVCRQMQDALVVTGWDQVSHVFQDPYDDDEWVVSFQDGEYLLKNLDNPDGSVVVLDLEKLGVNRR